MLAEYQGKIERLQPSQRLHFYELLAHNLTIVVRGVWSDDQIPDAGKVERLKIVNEIMHRVTAKIWGVRLNAWQYPDEIMIGMIEDYTSDIPDLVGGVEWAIRTSYEGIEINACETDEAQQPCS